ncbi:hypothetical protein [Enterococcus casseliflavus]|uniref:hypothetical protein n=1 Tax=Enterococcus casseliflavus TaxID=37734 RepID=UPI00115D7CDD|nr:hypothetical protein [Enterococcus casseliflavus]DAK68204.1 MAG TPA: hypothetical protein [Caudoviricetes sp.]
MNRLLKRLKEERIQGSSAVLNYSNFDYWVNWDDIVDIVEDHDQPQLNENQQTILDELKINTDYQKFNKFQSVFWLLTTIIQYPDTLLAKAYKELTQDELEQIFQEFSQWAHEQEEEK